MPPVNVVAPGKLLLTGAYAVLEGAPAIVIAVDRVVTADASAVDDAPSREVVAAFGAEPAPRVDARALFDGATKLGLGSSAAVLVAALGARAANRGASLADPGVRRRLFDDALAAHAQAQGGGSGVDVAACVHGGALRYERDASGARMRAVELPRGLTFAAFFSGTSARTSDLRGRVDAFAARDRDGYHAVLARLVAASHVAADAVDDANLDRFLVGAAAFRDALAALGDGADAPIVPRAFSELSAHAAGEGAVFLPSGAGGGDVGVYLARAAPSQRFYARASALGMTALDLRIDTEGVRISPLSPTTGAQAPTPSTESAHHG